MIWWTIFIVIFGSATCAAYRFVPAEHRLNYAQCRKDGTYWSALFLSHSAWIVTAIQSAVAPSDFPAPIRIGGVLLLILGYTLQIWAWRVNYLFLPIIIYVPPHLRTKSGPYSFCKHPGYFGFILTAEGNFFLLGQWWALFPMVAYVVLILRRMIVEDRVLSSSQYDVS